MSKDKNKPLADVALDILLDEGYADNESTRLAAVKIAAKKQGQAERNPMTPTLPPISERTDEQLVTAIAKWMGYEINDWWDKREALQVKRGSDWPLGLFEPNNSSDDRERVMLAMNKATFSYWKLPSGWFTVNVSRIKGGKQIHSIELHKKTLGSAFCEAVVMYIEAQP